MDNDSKTFSAFLERNKGTKNGCVHYQWFFETLQKHLGDETRTDTVTLVDCVSKPMLEVLEWARCLLSPLVSLFDGTLVLIYSQLTFIPGRF